MLDIFKGGEEYISASRAAEKSDYASDYIGQLCRQKKIPGQLIGRTWYIDYNALVEYKKTKKALKVVTENPSETSFLSTQLFSAENVARAPTVVVREARQTDFLKVLPEEGLIHFLPPLSKKSKYVRPVLTHKVVKEISMVTLSLIVAVSVGFFALEQNNPLVAKVVKENLGNVSSQLVSVSFADFISNPLNSLFAGFADLKDAAMKKIFFASVPKNPEPSPEKPSLDPAPEPAP